MAKNCNCEIDDGKDLYPENLDESKIPGDSIFRFIHGEYRHLLTKDKDGKYQTAVIPQAKNEDITPADLYDCLEDKHSPNLFCNKEHPAVKGATIALFVVIGFLLFFLFMIWAANLGN